MFQSFSAVASSLDFHVIDKEHLQQEHQHSIDDKIAAIPLQDIDVDDGTSKSTKHHNSADCHHCGHCHGTHAQWFIQQHSGKILLAAQLHQFFYFKIMIDGQVSRLLRPPKQ
ncbi:hypothetical protein GPUN_0211 [Glaciecola punicea ACAM 611]|uniref:Uncharacterized protein n=1 Tax=Glaciecola punicea ACAM 611 TaxID=1121923 RepID=H5T7T8_9ALTE|nr:hypothetical protein GPUN_0211 [Glaciecola punicea ACAM 611]